MRDALNPRVGGEKKKMLLKNSVNPGANTLSANSVGRRGVGTRHVITKAGIS